MRGHVRKRGSKWCVVIFTGIGPDGKRKYKWHSGFDTKKAAEKFLASTVQEIHTGTYVEPSKETVSTYFTRWLDDKETQVRFNTFKKYRWLTTRYVIPRLGAVEISKLSPRHLQTLYTELQRMDKPLSNRSILHLHNMVHEALERAVKWGLCYRNVADAVDPPRPVEKEMHVWTREQVMLFLREARAFRYYMVFLLAVTTGMRKAEICGLRWHDVDLENGRLNVRQTLVYKNGLPTFENPKTTKGRRTVSLPAQVVEELRRHRVTQLEERMFFASEYEDNDLVNCREDGRPIYYRTLDNQWIACQKRAELPRIRFHDLRHTHATLLFEQGAQTKLVSERLGHARTSITLDIYTHVRPEQHDEVAQNFGDALFGKRRSK